MFHDPSNDESAGPLKGLTIAMMGGLGPGPFCGMLLGDLGAEVVRVDRISEVDGTLPPDEVLRRNQRSIAVDVKTPRGREIVLALAKRSDAFVDVYRPGVMERLGLGPEDLMVQRPDLAYVRVTGYGQDGPLAQMAGHDINFVSLSGALHAIGVSEMPVPPLNLIGDFGGGGMLAAVGLLSAIFEARQSGRGQIVDVAMIDGAALLMAPIYGMFARGMWQDRRQANLVDGGAHFYRTYETADGKHFAVGAIEPQFYAEFCALLGETPPQDYDDPESWDAHAERIATRFRQKTRGEWEHELTSSQSCASPVLSLDEAPEHPQNRYRSNFARVRDVVQPAPAPRFSRTRPMIRTEPSLPGDHTLDVLRELGYTEEMMDAAAADGIVRQSATARE